MAPWGRDSFTIGRETCMDRRHLSSGVLILEDTISVVLIVNLGHISHIVLVFPVLTLNK